MKQKIRDILGKHGGLPVPVDTLADDADLYAAGLSSFASVQVMLLLKGLRQEWQYLAAGLIVLAVIVLQARGRGQ